MANIGSVLVKEIREAKDIFTKLLQEGIAGGDKAAEDAARAELKSLQELERQYTKVPATTGKPGKGPEQLGGLPREKQAEFLSKQLEQSKSRAENLLSESRRKAKEAQQRGFAQGTGETIELGAGAQGIVPYKKPGIPTTARQIKETEPVTGELFERIKGSEATGGRVIDVEAKDVEPLQLKAAEGDEGGTFIRQEPGLRGGGETKATPRFDERGFEIKPEAAELTGPRAEPTELKSKIDRFKAPAGVAAGLGLAGSYATTAEEPVRFPGDMSQAEVMAERTTPPVEQKPTTLAGGLGLGGKQKETTQPKSVALQGRPDVTPEQVTPPPTPPPAPSLRERIEQSLSEQRETTKAERDEAMRRADIGELASLVGRSLAQIGAAAQGMRTGVDMSGVAQKAMVDWDRKREQILNSYDSSIKDISRQQELLLRQAEREEDRADKKDYQDRAEKLERDKMAQEERLAMLETSLKEQWAAYKALSEKDEKAAKYLQGNANLKAKNLNRQIEKLKGINGIYTAWSGATGKKDKTKLELQLRNAIGSVLPPNATTEERTRFYGAKYTAQLEPEELIKLVTEKQGQLEADLAIQEEIAEGLRQAMSPEKGEAKPAAPAQTAAAPAAGTITVEMDGRRGEIPAAQLDSFRAKYPNAKVIQQ